VRRARWRRTSTGAATISPSAAGLLDGEIRPIDDVRSTAAYRAQWRATCSRDHSPGSATDPEDYEDRKDRESLTRSAMPLVRFDTDGAIAVVTIDRPAARTRIDGPTAAELAAAFRAFDGDAALSVAVLPARGGTFCAGADLKGMIEGRAIAWSKAATVRSAHPDAPQQAGDRGGGGSPSRALRAGLWCDLRVRRGDAGSACSAAASAAAVRRAGAAARPRRASTRWT